MSKEPEKPNIITADKRSEVWKYFGYPTDEHNNITTREWISCLLCKRMYKSYGTKNMRTHLLHKHKEIYAKLEKLPAAKPGRVRKTALSTETSVAATAKLSSTPKYEGPAINLFVDIVVRHMYDIDVFDKDGLMDCVRELNGYNLNIPTRDQLHAQLVEQYNALQTTQLCELKTRTASGPFTLCLEQWYSNSQERYVSVYCNYLDDAGMPCNRFHKVFKDSTVICSVSLLLQEFDLQHCVAVTANYTEQDVFLIYCQEHGIPVLLAFDEVIRRCLQAIIALPEVAQIFVMVKNTARIIICSSSSTSTIVLPEATELHPWSYYEQLKCYACYFFDDSIEANVKIIKAVMSALENLLKIVQTSNTQFVGMLWPLTQQFAQEYFTPVADDAPLLQLLKSTVHNQLNTHVLNNATLFDAAILDPKFIRDSYDADNDIRINALYMAAMYQNFYKPQVRTQNPDLDVHTSIEKELLCYHRNSANVDVGAQSPAQWWRNNAIDYKYLPKLASLYQVMAIACSPAYQEPISKQIQLAKKRANLEGDLLSMILFLHNHRQE